MRHVVGTKASQCSHCNEWLYWFDDHIVVPDVSAAPAANEDLADDIKADYAEAASIDGRAPEGRRRSSACVFKNCATNWARRGRI